MKPTRIIGLDTVCSLTEAARFCGVGQSTIYAHVAAGYAIQYPRIRKTTPAHYLAWASLPKTDTDGAASERAREIERLLSGAAKPGKLAAKN